jgi:hypothetical protein
MFSSCAGRFSKPQLHKYVDVVCHALQKQFSRLKMKKSTIFLMTMLVVGLVYSFYKLLSGSGGSGLYDAIDALAYGSIVISLSALLILIVNIKTYKHHLDTFLFLLLGLPLTISSIKGEFETYMYNRPPDLSVKYRLPISREQYLVDSTNIKATIDSIIISDNENYGGPDVLSSTIDTIIYSQTGDKIFVVYIKKFERNQWDNDLAPDYLVASTRNGVLWQLRSLSYQMSGSFQDTQILKKEVRKFYFNQFSFLDRDINSKKYFWRLVL